MAEESPAAIDSEWLDPINSEERIRHETLFYSQGPVDGYLTGERARDLFLHSRLPLTTLSQIWNLADVSNDNLLSRDEFVLVMHLIQGILLGRKVPKSLPGHLVPKPLPDVNLPVISDQEKQAFNRVFQRVDEEQKGSIEAKTVGKLLTASKLPVEQLAKVWDLADVNKDGALDRDEWIVACQLVRILKQGHSIEGPVNVFTYVPDKISPTSLQARRNRVDQYEKHKQKLMLLKERRKAEVTKESKRLELVAEKVKLQQELYRILRKSGIENFNDEDFQSRLSKEKENLERIEEVVIRLKKEHEKVRQETVKVILGEHKLYDEQILIKHETDELNKRLAKNSTKATKDPDPFHQLHELRREQRKKSTLSEGEEPEVHLPFKISPFDKDALSEHHLTGKDLFSESHTNDNNNTRLSSKHEAIVNDLCEFGDNFLEFWSAPSLKSASPDSTDMETATLTEEESVFKSIQAPPDEESWFGVSWSDEALLGVEDRAITELHKKLVDLKNEMHKLNGEGNQIVFRNPEDYLARKKAKEEEERLEKSKHQRRSDKRFSAGTPDKEIVPKRRSYVERSGDPDAQKAREYRQKRRSLNFDHRSKAGEAGGQSPKVPERHHRRPVSEDLRDGELPVRKASDRPERPSRHRPYSEEVRQGTESPVESRQLPVSPRDSQSPDSSPSKPASGKKTRAPNPPTQSPTTSPSQSPPPQSPPPKSQPQDSKIPVSTTPRRQLPETPTSPVSKIPVSSAQELVSAVNLPERPPRRKRKISSDTDTKVCPDVVSPVNVETSAPDVILLGNETNPEQVKHKEDEHSVREEEHSVTGKLCEEGKGDSDLILDSNKNFVSNERTDNLPDLLVSRANADTSEPEPHSGSVQVEISVNGDITPDCIEPSVGNLIKEVPSDQETPQLPEIIAETDVLKSTENTGIGISLTVGDDSVNEEVETVPVANVISLPVTEIETAVGVDFEEPLPQTNIDDILGDDDDDDDAGENIEIVVNADDSGELKYLENQSELDVKVTLEKVSGKEIKESLVLEEEIQRAESVPRSYAFDAKIFTSQPPYSEKKETLEVKSDQAVGGTVVTHSDSVTEHSVTLPSSKTTLIEPTSSGNESDVEGAPPLPDTAPPPLPASKPPGLVQQQEQVFEIIEAVKAKPRVHAKMADLDSFDPLANKSVTVETNSISQQNGGFDLLLDDFQITTDLKNGQDDLADSDLSDMEDKSPFEASTPGDQFEGKSSFTSESLDLNNGSIQLTSYNATQSPDGSSQPDSAFEDMLSSMTSDLNSSIPLSNTLDDFQQDDELVVEILNEENTKSSESPGSPERSLSPRRADTGIVEKAQQFAHMVQKPPKMTVKRMPSKGDELSDESCIELEMQRRAIINESTVKRRDLQDRPVQPDSDDEGDNLPREEVSAEKSIEEWKKSSQTFPKVTYEGTTSQLDWDDLPSKVSLYSENVVQESGTSDSVDRESIADLAQTRLQWETILKTTVKKEEKASTPKPVKQVRHWEVKLPHYPPSKEIEDSLLTENLSEDMDQITAADPYANENAIDREIRLAMEREDMLRKEQEERQELQERQQGKTVISPSSIPATNEVEPEELKPMYHELTEADRGSEMQKRETLIQQEIKEQEQREEALRHHTETYDEESDSENETNDQSMESIIEKEIRLQREREEEVAKARTASVAPPRAESPSAEMSVQKSGSLHTSAITNGDEPSQPEPAPEITYEEAISKYHHDGESLIARELRELKEREEDLKKQREMIPKFKETVIVHEQSTPVAKQPVSRVLSNEPVKQGTWQKDVSPYVHSQRRESLDSQNSSQSAGKGSSDITHSKNVKVQPFSDESPDDKPKYEPRQETPIQREIRIAQERENELRRQKGLPVIEPAKDENENIPEYHTTPTSSGGHYRGYNYSQQKPGLNTMKKLASSRLQHEIMNQKERELTLRQEGKIKTTSEEHIEPAAQKYQDVIGYEKSETPVKRNFVTKKSEYSPPQETKTVQNGAPETEHKILTPQKSAEGPKVRKQSGASVTFNYRESMQKAESKIEKELREMREREDELRKQRVAAGATSPTSPRSPRDAPTEPSDKHNTTRQSLAAQWEQACNQ